MTPADFIQAYLENDLAEAELRALQSWLNEDPAHLEQLVIEGLVDSQLRDVYGETKLRKNLLALARKSDQPWPVEAAPVPAGLPIHGSAANTWQTPSGAPGALSFSLAFAAAIVGVAASLAACIVLTAGLVERPMDNAQAALAREKTPHGAALPLGSGKAVARLSRVAAVRWAGNALRPGQSLAVGQSIDLDSGVLEMLFDVGARVVVQAPATLKVESASSLRLYQGKLTAEITDNHARGFRVNTPSESIVDQGTEFGVEVTPRGNSRVHVFKGAVDISSTDHSQPSESRRLLENSGARLEDGDQVMTLMQDTGESFIRHLEDFGRDQHVVAYWRFEDRPVGAILPDTGCNSQQVCATVDSSFNGNDLYTYIPQSRPTFSDRVPNGIIPQTGCINRSCLDNYSVFSDKGYGRDVYTHSEFSHAAPIDIQKITPHQWTIEVSIWLHGAEGEDLPQTFVSRDATYSPLNLEGQSRLAFQVNADRRFVIRFADVQGRFHEAIAEQLVAHIKQWYHLAAVSDGRSLRLYVDTLDGRGYQVCAETALPSDGCTALGKGEKMAEWAIGRGHVGKWPGEWFHGMIDEVRVSDVARKPGEFLFSRPAGGSCLRRLPNRVTREERDLRPEVRDIRRGS